MGGDPYTEHGDVDARYHGRGAPFQLPNSVLAFCDDGYPVDDNLHEQLDLKDPKEEEEEEDRHPNKSFVSILSPVEPGG